MPYCEQCGREVTAGAKWCRHCGARQPTDEAAQPTAEPARPVEAAQAEVEPTRAGATETAPAQPLLRSTEPEAIPTRQSSGPGLAPRTETRIPVSTPAPLVQQLEVTRDSAWLAARDGPIVVGALFVVCFVITALVLVIASHGTGLGDWLRVGGWLTGMTLRGHLTGAATQAGPLGEVGTLAFQPGSLFAAAMALAAWRAARTERTRPSRTLPSLAAHAAITALTAAGVVAIIAVASRGQSSFSAGDQQFGGGGASLGVGVISAVFGTAVYVWLAATLGRIVGSGHRTVLTDPWRARLEAFSEPARRLGEFTAISGVAVCLLGIVALLAGHAAISVWLFALFTLPSLFLAGALTSWGAGWSFSASVGISSFGGSVGQTQGMLDGGVPAWFYLLLLIPIASAVLVAARGARTRPLPSQPPWGEAWRSAALAAVGAAAVTFITSITGGAGAIGVSGSVRLGLAWGTTTLAAAAWGTLVALAPFLITRLVGASTLSSLTPLAERLLGAARLKPSFAARTRRQPTGYGRHAPAAAVPVPPSPTAREEPTQPLLMSSPPDEPATATAPVPPPFPEQQPGSAGESATAVPEVCAECGHQNRPDSRFCGRCGAELLQPSATTAVTPGHPTRRRRLSPAVIPAAAIVLALVAVAVVAVATGAFSSGHHGRTTLSTVTSRFSNGSAIGAPTTPTSATSPSSSTTTTTTTQTTPPYSEGDFVATPPNGWSMVESGQDKGGYVESKWQSPDGSEIVLVDMSPASNLPPEDQANAVRNPVSQETGYQELSFGPGDIVQQPSEKWVFRQPGSTRVDWFFSHCGHDFAVLGVAPTDQQLTALTPTFKAFANSVSGTCGT